MDFGKMSISAEIDAIIRWVETEKPEGERLCYDPLAKEFVGPHSRSLGNFSFIGKAFLWYVDHRHPGFLDCVPARTRYIDEYVNSCVDDGIEQLVNLGAGFDSRPYRLDRLEEKVTVFEVDHPATQKWKIRKVKRAIGAIPGHVRYVPIDFNREDLLQVLLRSGYEKDRKSLFIWEGVTPYLTPEAVDETLDFVAKNSGVGSSIIFSYVIRSVVDGTCPDEKAEKVRSAFNSIFNSTGERLRFGIDEGTIEEFLSERGFHQIRDISGDFYEAEYFKGPNRDRRVCCLCRVAYATVKH